MTYTIRLSIKLLLGKRATLICKFHATATGDKEMMSERDLWNIAEALLVLYVDLHWVASVNWLGFWSTNNCILIGLNKCAFGNVWSDAVYLNFVGTAGSRLVDTVRAVWIVFLFVAIDGQCVLWLTFSANQVENEWINTLPIISIV